MPVTSKQISVTVSHRSRGNFGFCNTRSRFDTSSAVQWCSASLHLPDTVYTISLPERSAPCLLNTAPSGGLQTLSAQRMRWTYHHLLFSIEKNYHLLFIRDTPNNGQNPDFASHYPYLRMRIPQRRSRCQDIQKKLMPTTDTSLFGSENQFYFLGALYAIRYNVPFKSSVT